MNFFSLRSAWPSLIVETEPDWSDHVSATALRAAEVQGRAWWSDTVLLANRSAAFRGPECGERTQRTAAEAERCRLARELHRIPRARLVGTMCRNVLRFAGVSGHIMDISKCAFKHP